MTTAARQLDTTELKQRVQSMYEEVALEPEREFHFETGRPLAERLGYPPADLDRIPAAAIDSFAGVGYFLDLAVIAPGETVLDLGSGAGMDSFRRASPATPRCGPHASAAPCSATPTAKRCLLYTSPSPRDS